MPHQKKTHPEDRHRHEEPTTHASDSHPVSTGIGATAGVLTGATVGLVVAGPIGEVVGAVIGGALGGWSGSAIGELLDPNSEREYWRQRHPSQPHALEDVKFEVFEPAYRIGYERYVDLKGHERSFEEAEAHMRHEYEQSAAVLPWSQVRDAARAAWNRVHESQQTRAIFAGETTRFPLGTPRVSHESIAMRAWFIYEKEGYPQDRALDHWLRAEREQQMHEAIALRAWCVYEKEGYPQDRALDHWLHAEREQQMCEAIALRAWCIYQKEGYPQDRALDHWLRAKREQQMHEAIALRAWCIYQKEGYPQDRALDHWLRAEREEQPHLAAA